VNHYQLFLTGDEMRTYFDHSYKELLDKINKADTGRTQRQLRNSLISHLKTKASNEVLYTDFMYNGKPCNYTTEQALFNLTHPM